MAIRSIEQYMITLRAVDNFKEAWHALYNKGPAVGADPKLHQIQLDAIVSVILELEDDLNEYDQNVDRQFNQISRRLS